MVSHVLRFFVAPVAALVAVAVVGFGSGVAFADDAPRPAVVVLQTGRAHLAGPNTGDSIPLPSETINVSAGTFGVDSATNVSNITEAMNISAGIEDGGATSMSPQAQNVSAGSFNVDGPSNVSAPSVTDP